jgi:hypothetical protein
MAAPNTFVHTVSIAQRVKVAGTAKPLHYTKLVRVHEASTRRSVDSLEFPVPNGETVDRAVREWPDVAPCLLLRHCHGGGQGGSDRARVGHSQHVLVRVLRT